ncbi:hypothetical protein NDU88_006496 [Pleurodeles waltl]|uniref:Uncharacterized protein n=1 Tax=Pleurodeles waltl TaxID=8319 RepID=A0AAV7TXT4_PLEWA|nr:hypothetical protein NDU88_006496 [Pleurodeles waltl]
MEISLCPGRCAGVSRSSWGMPLGGPEGPGDTDWCRAALELRKLRRVMAREWGQSQYGPAYRCAKKIRS